MSAIRFHAARILCALGVISFSPLLSSSGAEVHISFLQDTNSFRQTINLLTNSGCTQQGIAVFQQAVLHYFEEPFAIDLARLPRPINGFYYFASPHDLVAAFTNNIGLTKHSYDFSCMDAVIALADGRLKTTLRPDDIVGTILVITSVTNSEAYGFAATPRDAFDLMRSSEHADAGYPLFPSAMCDARICLEPLLRRWYVLPRSTEEDAMEAKVLEALRSTWQREALKFPSNFEVVLLHNVFPSEHLINACHAALLFQNNKGFTYIEKAGTRGPFIRLDLADRSDLFPWLTLAFGDYAEPGFRHFATFNDRSIKKIRLQ